jgi:hypothetical protein
MSHAAPCSSAARYDSRRRPLSAVTASEFTNPSCPRTSSPTAALLSASYTRTVSTLLRDTIRVLSAVAGTDSTKSSCPSSCLSWRSRLATFPPLSQVSTFEFRSDRRI